MFGGGCSAVQVVAEKTASTGQRMVLLARLNVDSPVMPGVDELEARGVAADLHQTHDAYLWSIDDFVPWWATEIGAMRILEAPFTNSGALGLWAGVRADARMARRYAQGVPKPDPYAWRRDSPTVTVDLGGVAKDYPVRQSNLQELAALLPESGPVNWSGLGVLSNLYSVTHAGAERGLIGALAKMPLFQRLTWKTPKEDTVDLRGTRLTALILRGVNHPMHIRLPDSCAQLQLEGRYDLVTVDAEDVREGFELQLKGPFSGLPNGLDEVLEVTFFDAACIDAAALTAWRELRSLRIVGSASRIRNTGALQALKHLKCFNGSEIYGLDAHEFPATGLYDVRIDGLRATDAKVLRQRLRDLPRAQFSKTRSDKWIAENFDNPFRSWESDGAAFGKAAMKLWKDGVKAAAAFGGKATASDARDLVKSLVLRLNKLDERHGIDTLRREQACEALDVLVRDHLGGVLDAEETQHVIDATRDW